MVPVWSGRRRQVKPPAQVSASTRSSRGWKDSEPTPGQTQACSHHRWRGGERWGLDPADGRPLTCPPPCPTRWPQTQVGTAEASLLPAGPVHRACPAPGGPRGDQEGPRGWSGRETVMDRVQGALYLGGGGATCRGLLSLLSPGASGKAFLEPHKGVLPHPDSHRGHTWYTTNVLCAWWVPECHVPASVPEGPQHLLPPAPPKPKLSEGRQGVPCPGGATPGPPLALSPRPRIPHP